MELAHNAAGGRRSPTPSGGCSSSTRRLATPFFTEARLSPTYPRAMAREPRVNGGPKAFHRGSIPRRGAFTFGDLANQTLTLDEVRRLPRAEMTTELRCIEGWSVIVNWAGCRLRDFVAV